MGRRSRARRSLRGTTLTEVLVAGLLLCIGMMGLVNVWLFAFRVTLNTDDKGTAYCLGRQQMERVKMAGFSGAPEGTWGTLYFDSAQNQVSATTARFKVDTSVSSAPAWPNNASTRTVAVTVRYTSGGAIIYQTSTYLVRAGI